jgi:hypothetical protein
VADKHASTIDWNVEGTGDGGDSLVELDPGQGRTVILERLQGHNCGVVDSDEMSYLAEKFGRETRQLA